MEIIKANKMVAGGVFRPKFMVIGPSGGGKTTALTTLPPEWKVINVDVFGNMESLEGASNIEIVSYTHLDLKDVQSYIRIMKDMDEISREIEKGTWNCASLDTITGMMRFTEYYILGMHPEKKGIGGSPAKHHYRGIAHVVGEFLTKFISLPCAVILNAHADTVEDKGGGLVQYQAMISGKRWRGSVYAYLGEVYRAFGEPSADVDEGGEPKTEYFWQTQPDDLWPMLKSVMNQKQRYWGKYVEPNYAELFRRRGVI